MNTGKPRLGWVELPAPLAPRQAAVRVSKRAKPPSGRSGLLPGWRSLRAQEGELGRRLLLGAPLAAVGFAIWAFGGVYGWAYGGAYVLIFAALAIWCVQCWRGKLPMTWRPVYLPVLLVAGLVGAQLVWHLSAVPAASLTAALHLGAAGTAFFLITQLYRGDRDAGWIMPGFAVFTAALALLAILQLLTSAHAIYWKFTYTYASPAGSFVNRNHFSGCMELLLPMACAEAYFRRRRGWLRFLPWAAAPAVAITALILAASRGGMLALIVEVLAGVVVFWLREHRRAADSTSGRRRRMAAAISAVALTAVLVWAAGTSRLQARTVAASTHAPGVEQRRQLNRSSWAMFRQRPGLGWGLGTWADVYPAFARFTDPDVFEFAHNDYLQWLSETGLAGAGCAILFWVLWAGAFRRRLQVNEGGQVAAVGALVACLGLLSHSWVDFNLHIPANLLLFFEVAGIAITLPPGARSSEEAHPGGGSVTSVAGGAYGGSVS